MFLNWLERRVDPFAPFDETRTPPQTVLGFAGFYLRPIRATLAALFKKADRLSAFHEATQLAGFAEAEARRLFSPPPVRLKTPRLVPLPTAEAQAHFLERFHRLAAKL